MNYSFLVEICSKFRVEIFFCTVGFQNLNFGRKLVLDHGVKPLENRPTLDFSFIKNNQVTLSMAVDLKVTNHRIPDRFLIRDGPQTSLWIR